MSDTPGLTWTLFDGDGPNWQRRVAISGAGEVFAPAALSGDEQQAATCAARDGVNTVVSDPHVFLPLDWLAREYPDLQEARETLLLRLDTTAGE